MIEWLLQTYRLSGRQGGRAWNYPYYNSFKRKYEKQGYSEFSPDHAETIVLKYALKSSEEAESITKSVIPLLNERLGWLGLGYVDGYDVDVKRSIFRKPKLQVFCIVIDGNLAAKIIPSALENTPFRYVMYL